MSSLSTESLLYTMCVLSVYLFVIFISKISAFISLMAIDSCYFCYITGGYIPALQLSINAQISTISVFFGMSCIFVLALYLYEFLVFVAYLTVCVSIVVKYLAYLRLQKKTQNNVTQIVTEYHDGIIICLQRLTVFKLLV